MPVKLRRAKGKTHRITPEAIAAYRAGDYLGLHRSLGLRPWQPSPLPLAVDALGVDPDHPPQPDGTGWASEWPLAVELQKELQAAVAR